MTDQIIINGYDHNSDIEKNLKSFSLIEENGSHLHNHMDVDNVSNRRELNLKCSEPIYEEHSLNGCQNFNHINDTVNRDLSPKSNENVIDSSVIVNSVDSKLLNTGEETILCQETGFNIKIQSPGTSEPIELTVSSVELVQEILQVLIDREDTCCRTCFTLQLDGVTLDNFAELKTIEGLKEGSVLKVVEELYTVREARIHVRHICDLLKSLDLNDAYAGIDCSSLTFVNNITNGNVADRKLQKSEIADWSPPEYILPGSKDRPILPLHPISKDLKGPQCLKVLTYSGWNPPPGPRKMHGDLLYLFVVTMEDKRFHITASTQGFFLNQCSMESYNPKPSGQKYVHHSLVDLLNQISPIFKRNFHTLLKKRQQKHPFERVVTPYQVHSWLSPFFDHTIDYIRAEDAFSSRLGYEEHIPGQTRDWNEELQTTRDLPRKSLPERLIRERTVFKVHSDFVGAAVRGAMSVVDGNIMAINPGEDTKMQMFLWNNIFLSLGFDVKDHFKEFGGDYAAYTAPGCDLQGVKAYTGADIEGLHTLGTVVVDYRGYRVTAQSIIPGILEKEQEQSVVYGSIDFGKTIVSNDKYKELLEKAAQPLKIRSHKVLNGKDEEIELASSVECKGIIGNDGRYYILDLLRTFAPDPNFLPIDPNLLSERVRALNFPRKHRHRLSCLRQELVEAFFENRYVTFVKMAAQQFQNLRLKKLEETINGSEKTDPEPKTNKSEVQPTGQITTASPKMDLDSTVILGSTEAKKLLKNLSETVIVGPSEKPTTDIEPCLTDMSKLVSILDDESATKDIIRTAARAVGSLLDDELCIQFNTDVFQDHVKHAPNETLKREEQLAIDASEFILFNQIPHFVAECLDQSSCPVDCFTLTETLHNLGINMRYLGVVTTELAKYPQLSYLYSICIMCLVTRGVKHLYKPYMQGVDSINLAAAISHFLNCYLGSYPNPHEQIVHTNEEKPKKKKVPTATLR